MSTTDILTWIGIVIAIIAGVATLAPILNPKDPDKARDWTGGVIAAIGFWGGRVALNAHYYYLALLGLGMVLVGLYVSTYNNKSN